MMTPSSSLSTSSCVVINYHDPKNNKFIQQFHIYPIVFFLLFISYYISFKQKNIPLLATIGHLSMLLTVFYNRINYKTILIFIGHTMLFFYFSLLLVSSKIETPCNKQVLFLLPVSSHILFSMNYFRMLVDKTENLTRFQRLLFVLMIFSNMGFVLNYYLSTLDEQNDKVSNQNYKEIIQIIHVNCLRIVCFYFFHQLITNPNNKIFSHVIMTTYYFSQFYFLDNAMV